MPTSIERYYRSPQVLIAATMLAFSALAAGCGTAISADPTISGADPRPGAQPSASADVKSDASGGQSSCSSCDLAGIDASDKPTLTIRWKRRVDGSSRTVSSHAAAEQQLDLAFATLKKSLEPTGVEVVLQKAVLSEEQFAKDPLNSNRIWLNGAALEMYLPNATIASTKDAKSGDVFRTVEFAGTSLRDVPHKLIVHAGLIAAADSVKEVLEDARALGLSSSSKSCCPNASAACCSAAGASCCKQGSVSDATKSCSPGLWAAGTVFPWSQDSGPTTNSTVEQPVKKRAVSKTVG